jgi:hypothetical protein
MEAYQKLFEVVQRFLKRLDLKIKEGSNLGYV